MARDKKTTGDNRKPGRFRRAASFITRFFHRGTHEAEAHHVKGSAVHHSRPTHRQTDVAMNQIEEAYVPTQTSLKGPFRASGADQQRDQEFGNGMPDDRWKDEDLITNKSGDPRIGTHGRTYEPGEKRS